MFQTLMSGDGDDGVWSGMMGCGVEMIGFGVGMMR